MFIAPAATTPIAPAFAGASPDSGRNLGRLDVRFRNLEEGGTFTAHYQLVAGGLVGAAEGYQTLAKAMRELAPFTEVNAPAVAVIERNGRYYGHVLKSRDLEYGITSRVDPLYIESDSMSQVLDVRAIDRFDHLRAIVDGDFTRRFRA